MKQYLQPLYAPVANWWYDTFKGPRRYHHLFDSIRATKARRILEVGTWNGDRAKRMIHAAQASHPPAEITYFGFDLFEDLSDALYHYELSKRPPAQHFVEEKLKTTGAHISLYKGNTLETLTKFSLTAEPVDFVFIDGGHHVDTIRSDWNAVQKLMHPGTIVIFDDYWRNRTDQGAKPVVDAIDRALYNVAVLSEVDVFSNADHGRLEISFARVTVRPQTG